MATQTDPIQPTIVDENENNCAALPLSEASNGFADNQVLTAEKFNRIARQASLFDRWLDQNSQRIELSNGATANCRLTGTSLRYAEGAGLTQPVVASGSYLIDGRLVQHTPARCAARGQSPHTFTASKTHHLWLKADGSIRFEVVSIGTPETGLPGEVYAGFVLTDATDVIQCEVPGDPFISTGYEFDEQRNLIDVVSQFRGDTLAVMKETGSTAKLRFHEDIGAGSYNDGWYFEVYGTNARRLQLVQMVNGNDTSCINFGDSDSGDPIAVSRPAKITSAEDGTGDYAFEVESSNSLGKGSKFTTTRTPAATFESAGTGGVPIVLVPRSPGFVLSAAVGSVEIGNDSDSDLQYKDNNSNTRIVFAVNGARHYSDGAYTATLNAISIGTLGASGNFPIVNGKRYRISMGCRIGRVAASTRDAQITATIGGIALPWSAHTVSLFQAGAANQLEHTWCSGEYMYTATTTATVSLALTITPINGAGNINIAYRWVAITGAWD